MSIDPKFVELTADVLKNLNKISKPLESAPRGSPSDPEKSMESNGHVSAFGCRYSILMSIDPFGYFLTTPYGFFEVTEAGPGL